MTDQVLAERKARVRIRMSVVIIIIFHRHLLSTCRVVGPVLGMGTHGGGEMFVFPTLMGLTFHWGKEMFIEIAAVKERDMMPCEQTRGGIAPRRLP